MCDKKWWLWVFEEGPSWAEYTDTHPLPYFLPSRLHILEYLFNLFMSHLSRFHEIKHFPTAPRFWWCQVSGGANMWKREFPLCLSDTVCVATIPDLCFNNPDPVDVTLHLVNLSFLLLLCSHFLTAQKVYQAYMIGPLALWIGPL